MRQGLEAVVLCSLLIVSLASLAVGEVGRAEQGLVSASGLSATCTPERPTVMPRESIRVTAWALPHAGEKLEYAWSATAGRLEGEGREILWMLTGAQPGPQTARVRVTDRTGGFVDCSLQVIVLPSGIPRAFPRESAWSFLVQGQAEAEGYGLYSYLLLGSPPGEASVPRYLSAIEAYLGLIPDLKSLEQYIPDRRDLNVAYLPIGVPPPSAISGKWVLEHYDYARSRALLRGIPGTHRAGPYIVSSLRPLRVTGETVRPLLHQDLSSVPPHLVSAWMKAFLNQAAQERFWEGRSVERLSLKLRTTIGVLALGLPDVQKALEGWIAWIR